MTSLPTHSHSPDPGASRPAHVAPPASARSAADRQPAERLMLDALRAELREACLAALRAEAEMLRRAQETRALALRCASLARVALVIADPGARP